MGTQQILMIILSVIVVGAAIAVGIQMFDTQSYNQEYKAVTLDLIQNAAAAQAWYRTPREMGGGRGMTPEELQEAVESGRLGKYIFGGNNAHGWAVTTNFGTGGLVLRAAPTTIMIYYNRHNVYDVNMRLAAHIDLAGGHDRIRVFCYNTDPDVVYW
jgi:hypothetical protein